MFGAGKMNQAFFRCRAPLIFVVCMMQHKPEVRSTEILIHIYLELRCAAPYQLFLLFFYKYLAALLPLIANDSTKMQRVLNKCLIQLKLKNPKRLPRVFSISLFTFTQFCPPPLEGLGEAAILLLPLQHPEEPVLRGIRAMRHRQLRCTKHHRQNQTG